MTKLWQILQNKIDPDWQPKPVPAWGAGAFSGLDWLWSWRAAEPPVSMWQPPEQPDEDAAEALAGWRVLVGVGLAQRRLGRAIRAAGRPVPCLQPGPNLWLSERAADRRKAVQLCQGCPVMAECAAIATADPVGAWGVFGGQDYSDDARSTAELLAELETVGRMPGAAAVERRNELFVRLASDTTMTAVVLAKAGSTSASTVGKVLRRNGITGRRGSRDERAVDRQRRNEVRAAEVAGMDGPILRELRTLGSLSTRAVDDAARRRRDELLAELRNSDPGFWTWARLGAAAGISGDGARGAVSGPRREIKGRPRLALVGQEVQAQRTRELRENRMARLAAEVAARADDPRVKRLQQLGRSIGRGIRTDQAVFDERLKIIAELWADDPTFWTIERLSLAMGLRSWSHVGKMLGQIRQNMAARTAETQRYA